MNIHIAKKLVNRGASVTTAFITEKINIDQNIDITRPSLIRGMVNERCNFKCGYCNCWNQDEYKNEISIDDWKKTLDSLNAYIGQFTIQFSGGEPFLKKRIY